MTSPGTPSIDIVIPVHTTGRPVERAVRSVVAARSDGTRAIVVCHNVAASAIAGRLGELATHDRVVMLELNDRIYSPAGPLNEGMRCAEAEYVGFLGSDDELMPGSLDAWAEELVARPDVLIGQIVAERSGRVFTPAPRPGRHTGLDPVRDLLNLRTAPVGVLARRKLLHDARCPGFRRGFRTGEDLALGLYLWNSAGAIAYSRAPEGYYVHEDGPDRVTAGAVDLSTVVAPLRDALDLPVLTSLPKRRRQSIGVKSLRHQLQYWRTALGQGALDEDALRTASDAARLLRRFAPGVLGFFARCDARAIKAVLRNDLPGFENALERADSTHYVRKLVPLNPFRALAPEAFFVSARRHRQQARRFPASAEVRPVTPGNADSSDAQEQP